MVPCLIDTYSLNRYSLVRAARAGTQAASDGGGAAASSGGGGGGGGGPGTASGACMLCLSDCRRMPEAELHFEAGAEPDKHKSRKRRAGRKHHGRKRGSESSLQIRAESPAASTDSSHGRESTPEKDLPYRVKPTSACTIKAVESVPVANCANKPKRQRDSSPARVPAMISGLTISDFGDLARDYKKDLERKSSVYPEDPGELLPASERKNAGKPTSGGDVSNWTVNQRRQRLEEERQRYQNRAARQHCELEAGHLLINNPFSVKGCGPGCGCIPPSGGDLLSGGGGGGGGGAGQASGAPQSAGDSVAAAVMTQREAAVMTQ